LQWAAALPTKWRCSMRVCVLYSGGKDSSLALLKASEHFEVSCLVSLVPRSVESVLFHYPNAELVRLQARALGLPLVQMASPDDEEGSVEALREALRIASERYGVEGVVTGAVRSTYQATRFQRVCWELGLWCFNPLWLRDEVSLLREVVDRGLEAIVTRVAGYPLRKSLLGRRIDRGLVEELARLRGYINPSGEGGEYETLVLDMPLFRMRIRIAEAEVVGEDYDATLLVRRAELVPK